jgi:Tfp pilus assembly protein FimV
MSATISVATRHPYRPNRSRQHRHDRSGRDVPARASLVPPRSMSPRRVSEATYRRRRAIVGTALAVFVAVGAVTAHDVLAGSGGVPASAAESQPARSTVVARPGDTLWSIADDHRGEISITRYVDKLVALNGGATIQVGQAVVLP